VCCLFPWGICGNENFNQILYMQRAGFFSLISQLSFFIEYTADLWYLGVVSGAKTNTNQNFQQYTCEETTETKMSQSYQSPPLSESCF
jgi:hypothetical protein